MYYLQGVYSYFLNPVYKLTGRIDERIRNAIISLCCFLLVGFFTLYFDPRFKQLFYLKHTRNNILCGAILVILVIFSIKAPLKKVRWDPWLFGLFFSAGAGLFLISLLHPVGSGYRSFGLMMMFGFPCLYYVWNNRGDYNELYVRISAATAVVGLLMYVYCFKIAAAGELKGIDIMRTAGVFYNANEYCMMGMIMVCSSIYLFEIHREHNKWFIFSAISFSVGWEIVFLGGSRLSLLVCLGSMLAYAIFRIKTWENTDSLKRTLLTIHLRLLVLFLILILSYFSGSVMLRINSDAIEKNAASDTGIKTEQIESSSTGTSENIGSMAERFDTSEKDLNTYTSGRIGIWKGYASHLNMWGNDFSKTDFSELMDMPVQHAHNNFLEYAYRCGVPVALLHIFLELYAGIICVIFLFSKKYRDPAYLFSVSFMVCYALESMFDIATVPFERPAPFFFYMALIPVFGRLSDTGISADRLEIIDLGQDAKQINDRLVRTEKDFIGFRDADAEYEDSYYTELLKALSLNRDAGCAKGIIKSLNGSVLKTNKKEKERYTKISAEKDPSKSVFFAGGAVFRTSLIREKELFFPEELNHTGDLAFAVRYLDETGAMVQANELSYRSDAQMRKTDPDVPESNEKSWYTESTLPLLNRFMKDSGELSALCQYTMLFVTILRFKANQNSKAKMALDSEEAVDTYLHEAGTVLRKISDDVLFGNKGPVKWDIEKQMYFARLRGHNGAPEYEVEYTDGDAVLRIRGNDRQKIRRLSKLKTDILTIHYAEREGLHGLDIRLKDPGVFPEDSYEIIFVNDADGVEHAAERNSQISRLIFFFNREAARMTTFRAFVPLDPECGEQSVSMYFKAGGCRIDRKPVFADNWQNKINSGISSSYWYRDGRILCIKDGKLMIRKASEADAERCEEAYLSDLRKLRDAEKNEGLKADLSKAIIWRETYRSMRDLYKGRRIWAYYDKGYKAGDNAEYSIRYAAKQDDGIEKLFYIDPESHDYTRLRAAGYTVMDPSSTEGVIAAMNAEAVFMTHVPPYRKLGIADRNLKYIKDLLDARVIRLYHGFPITESDSYSQIAYDSAAVAVGTTYEEKLYTNKDNAYEVSQVIRSGMPRYDDLVDTGLKQLLIAPTWRPSLTGRTLSTGESLYNERFRDSLFFRYYDQLITDPRLLETAKKNGYSIKIFMHPKLSAQTRDFTESELVRSLSCTKDIDYVSIMKDSSLMVTDYSSVQYDFAYMRKPVVYFHPQELPYWRPTTFDYENIGFGEICTSVSELVDVLCGYMDMGCVLSDMYKKRVEDFFIHSDREAGRRLYEETLKLFD